MRRARRLVQWVAALCILAASPVLWFDLTGGASTCTGKTHHGRIAGAVRLSAWGDNYRPYCWLCILALRTYGHAPVIETVEAAYADLAASHPQVIFKYGEIGWPWGGRFAPHRTHRNGLSVDFMVPLQEGRVLPTHALNRAGYDEKFDAHGRRHGGGGKIDFAAIGAHLRRLDIRARERGGRVRRVILAPDLQDELFAAAPSLGRAISFNRRPVWVRHDDHYHVDFAFPCEGVAPGGDAEGAARGVIAGTY